MIEPAKDAVDRWLDGEPVSHRSTSLRHASIHRRPGLLGDDADRPSSIVYARAGDPGQIEAFGAGAPDPSLDWLEANADGATIALLAPQSWEESLRARGGIVETATIVTFLNFDLMMLPKFSTQSVALKARDAAAFAAIAPNWALRSWTNLGSMLKHGLALGLHSANEIVSVAWTYESTELHDKIGVATLPRYRNLGLGRRVAGALIERIIRDRRKAPIWVTGLDNPASLELARSVGFSDPTEETLLRWTPDRG